jgi:mitogen-activated protein kinase 1/3
MITRKPIFPGTDYQHHLQLIFKLIGTPSLEDLSFIRADAARRYVARMEAVPRQDFRLLFPLADIRAIDMLQRIFQFNPDDRLSAAAALEHEYLFGYHDESLEPIAEAPFAFEFEFDDLPIDVIKHHLMQDSLQYQSGAIALGTVHDQGDLADELSE